MQRWLLPEAIEDLLPAEAAHVERSAPPPARRVRASWLRAGGAAAARICRIAARPAAAATWTCAPSSWSISSPAARVGVRADITPQVARIDAHLLNRKGVTRLCYCGSVLHTVPSGLLASREPLQIGAELYGHAGLEADIEIVRLLARSLELCARAGDSHRPRPRRRFSVRWRRRRTVVRRRAGSCSPRCRPRTCRRCANWSRRSAGTRARGPAGAARTLWRRRGARPRRGATADFSRNHPGAGRTAAPRRCAGRICR